MENAAQLYELLKQANDDDLELLFDGYCFYLLENDKRRPVPPAISNGQFTKANDFMRRVVKQCPSFLHNSFSCRDGVMLLRLDDDTLFQWKWGISSQLAPMVDMDHDGDMTLLAELAEVFQRYRNALPDVRKEVIDRVWESIREFDFELVPSVGQQCGCDVEWLLLPPSRCD